MGNEGERERVAGIIFNIVKTISSMPLYGEKGAQHLEACKKITADINDYCFMFGNFSVGEIKDQATFNDTVIESTNALFAKFVSILKSHFIIRIMFSAGVEQYETENLLKILSLKPVMLKREHVDEGIKKAGFNHINVNEEKIEILLDGGFAYDTDDSGNAPVGRGKKILVVEDNDKLRQMYKEELVKRGYEVKVVASGLEALEDMISGSHVPDVVVLDIKMAGMSGIEVLEKMRQSKIMFPVVVATAYPAMKDDPTIKMYPHIEFILKPFSYDSLVRIISKLTIRK